MIRWPTTSAKTTSAPSFSVVTARTCQTLSDCSLPPTMAGKSTSRRMVKDLPPPASRGPRGPLWCAALCCRRGRGSGRPYWRRRWPCRKPPRRPMTSRNRARRPCRARLRPDLGGRAGQDDTLDGQQVFKMEVEAHAEHEQDDADFRALGSRVRIGDETGGIGATIMPANR